MWRFLRSPRRVLGSLLAISLAISCLCLCAMIPYAYWDRPRIEIVSVNECMIKLSFIARVVVEGETFVYQNWRCASRTTARDQDCDKLSALLNSPDFLQTYRTEAVKRHGRLSDLFEGSDQRLAFRCEPAKYAVIDGLLQDFDGMGVSGIYSKRFAVHQPAYPWSRWLQARLPFMPNKTKLCQEANELNQDAADVLDSQVRQVCPDAEPLPPGTGWANTVRKKS
jgi:hypothetical protein